MARAPKKHTIKHLILDVDGVLPDGTFWYSSEGKVMKRFGPDDSDAIHLIKPHLEVLAISGDKLGFPITKKRVADDMGLSLFQVSTFERIAWITERYPLSEVAYMGDGIFDAMVFDKVGYAIAPANASKAVQAHADFVTHAKGGSGAVAEACFHLLERFFEKADILDLRIKGGAWTPHQKSKKSPR